VLQKLDSDEIYRSSEPSFSSDQGQSLDLAYYFGLIKKNFFYFLVVFGVISTLGLVLAAIQGPTYLSEGKILVQNQEISPDILTPVVTATAGERAQLIQQRVLTRDQLLSIANRFGIFPGVSDSSEVLDLMRNRIQIKPIAVEVDGMLRPNSRAVAFTVGFVHENPEIAMRVANELVALIIGGDERSRSGKTTEMVKLLASQAKDIDDKIEATQAQMLEVARRPRALTVAIPEEQKIRSTEIARLKTELTQKLSIYSDGHPSVTALKKRIATLEKQAAGPSQVPEQAQSSPDDEIEGFKRQRQALERQLADTNGKLASARLREKLDLEQQDRMQLLESPSLPVKPEKSKKIILVGMAFLAAMIFGIGAAIGPELLSGSIRGRHQLIGVVASPLIVSIPYITTRSDIAWQRLRVCLGVVSVIVILAAWGILATAIVLHLPLRSLSFDRAAISLINADT
jgi:uncharacterized protein involved in exopolysaccharide biosynthesis